MKTTLLAILLSIASAGALAQDMPVYRLSDMVNKIDMKNLLKIPVGCTLLDVDVEQAAWHGELSSVEVPREWSDGAKCAAIRVSNVIVDSKTLSIRGGLGSNVYPTIAEGAFAMTNEIVAAVSEISGGKAMVEPLRFHDGKYGEMKFWWKVAKDERELVVRCYVSPKKQMAVCTLLHTKGDGVRAEYLDPNAKR